MSKEAQVSEDAVEIESFELSDGSNPGENFACVLKSVRVRCRIGDQGEWAEKCYMAKLFPLSQGQETWLREVRDFQVKKYKFLNKT